MTEFEPTPDAGNVPPSAERARLRELRGLLQTVGSGGTLPEVLSRVVEWIERVIPDTLGSVLLLDAEGLHLRHAAAPSLAPAYCALIDGVRIGPSNGSCGTAAYTGEPVIVFDLNIDPLWDKYRALAAPYGLRACWSHPIRASTGEVLGTFALYRMQPSLPTDDEREMMVDASHITALLIERIRSDEVRRQHERDLRSILENARDLIIRLDSEGCYVYANPAMVRLAGVAASSIVGSALPELAWLAPLHTRLAAMMAGAAGRRAPYRDEFAVDGPEGERWLDALAVPEYADDGTLTGYVIVARDSTDRRHAVEALRRSEARLKLVFNLSGRSIALLDINGRLQEVGDVAPAKTGLDRERILGEYFWELPTFQGLPEAQETLRRTIAQAAAGESGGGDIPFRGRNGDMRIGWFHVVPVRDAESRVVELVLEVSDVTDTREMEQRLRQSEKMESLGRLAGGIAHDFNNILAALLGYGELLLGDAVPGTETYEGLQHIVHASRRARDLVRQILAFSRKTALEHSPVDLRALIVDGIRLLRASIPSTIEVRERVIETPLIVMGDASQLSQVLLNLGANAEYVLRQEADARLEIELSRVMLDVEHARALALSPGAYASLVVRDSGQGIAPDVLRKIFEPFFTTKPVGEGTGMGLAVVHGVVVAHGGAVHVDSSAKGTTFEVFFPIASTPAQVASQPSGEQPGGSGRLLVIDDERAIVELLQRVLPRRGFEVVGLTSPVEAIARFRASPDFFDLVITDRTMPHMPGDDVAAEVHAIRPGTPVIITSGREALPGDDDTMGDTLFHLAKPFDVVDLLRSIDDANRAVKARRANGSTG